MSASLEFAIGLLSAPRVPAASWEDFRGPHGPMLTLWREHGFVDAEPGCHPVPSCPHCYEGVPYRNGSHYLCHRCRSTVEERHFCLWRLDVGAFLGWLAQELGLRGGVRQVDESLWQLGSLAVPDTQIECFFRKQGTPSLQARKRLLAFRNALLLNGVPEGEPIEGFHGPCLALLEAVRYEESSLGVIDLAQFLGGRGHVRFEQTSGSLFAGDVWLGEVPVGSREFYFLVFLAHHLDAYVAYADIKHFVLQTSGSTDMTEEATFCQRLKSRTKKSVPTIDRLIATTNKGDTGCAGV
jgi:hypothetical protein